MPDDATDGRAGCLTGMLTAHRLWPLAVIFLAAAPARGESNVGFLMQPAVELGTGPSPQVEPGMRLGVSFRPLAVAVDASFAASGLLGNSSAAAMVLSLDVEPHLWHSEDGRDRLYLLAGPGVALITLTSNTLASTGGNSATASPQGGCVGCASTATALGLKVAAGGSHFFDAHFAVGLELGVKAGMAVSTPTLLIDTSAYVALVGTFATGG
jgi:hypothetical protein